MLCPVPRPCRVQSAGARSNCAETRTLLGQRAPRAGLPAASLPAPCWPPAPHTALLPPPRAGRPPGALISQGPKPFSVPSRRGLHPDPLETALLGPKATHTLAGGQD